MRNSKRPMEPSGERQERGEGGRMEIRDNWAGQIMYGLGSLLKEFDFYK